MRIYSIYREQVRDLFEGDFAVEYIDDGSIELGPVYDWNRNRKHFYVELNVGELLRLRDRINDHLGGLAGVTLITEVRR